MQHKFNITKYECVMQCQCAVSHLLEFNNVNNIKKLTHFDLIVYCCLAV